MKKHLNLTALLLVLIFAGCQKDVQRGEATEGAATQQKASTDGSTTTRSINLQVEVLQDVDNKILSDKDAPYIHGVDRVQAVIWGDSGDFFMTTNTNANRDALRWIRFDFDETSLLYDRLNNVRSYRMRTQGLDGDPASQLHKMADNSSKYVGFFIWGEKPAGVFDWKLRFQYHLDPAPLPTEPATSFVLVTKLSSSPNVWELESTSTATGYLKAGANTNTSITGYYQVPFRIKLTEKPR